MDKFAFNFNWKANLDEVVARRKCRIVWMLTYQCVAYQFNDRRLKFLQPDSYLAIFDYKLGSIY